MKDILQRFLFENAPIRGELVHLDETWKAVLARHEYPAPVRSLLGEMMAASALLSATLKYDGSITLQVQGDGPISLIVVEATSDKTLRGMAQWQGEVAEGDLQGRVGSGRLIITIDPGAGSERYQGVVELQGASLADALDDYLERSEQLPTRMWLAADGEQAAGMLLQRLPERESEDKDAWDRVCHLGATLSSEELLTLPAEQIIHRLFHEEDLRLFDKEGVSFSCACSRDRVAKMLRTLGSEEVHSILEEEPGITVDCEFCRQRYSFDSVDVEQIFAASEASPEVSTTRH
ncbi:Hsp33 family molecular chaperone [Solemya pervernicosa gill symbiont]|uniref:33 kDa chaperonin n=2 Tax=Gammaproteobacteria incertae sedis TaxID=118884 RepID=A0A1T2L4T0_9GAMM|nr:Hsp33 family molecular chaperone [Solemya pervernicosa gill symbiont]